MNHYEDLLVDALLDRGFTLDEAERLIALQAQVERDRREEEERARFAHHRPERVTRVTYCGGRERFSASAFLYLVICENRASAQAARILCERHISRVAVSGRQVIH